MFRHFFKCQTLVPVQVAAYVTIEAAAQPARSLPAHFEQLHIDGYKKHKIFCTNYKEIS